MLVTLEGLDGSGKTTAWEALSKRHPEAVLTREPTDSWYGDAVYRSLEDEEADPIAELFLYTADHAAHLSRTVRPALRDDRLVISDRYSDSRFAYQAATLEGTIEQPLSYVRELHAPFSRPPDATVYFDVDPETAAERSGATNKFEQAAYLADVREYYEQLIAEEPDRFVRIDATRAPAAVLEAVETAMDQLLPDQG
jgi:dTMP kinase